MDRALTRMARLQGVAGVASIFFGVTVLVWPGISLVSLTALFGAFAFVYGIFSLGAGLNLIAHKSTAWVPPVLSGAGGTLIGVITFLHPAITVLALTYLIAAWAFMVGVFAVMHGIEFWGEVRGAVWLVVSGGLSVAFGLLVALQPAAGVLGILWMIGAYAVVAGTIQVGASIEIHQLHTEVKREEARLGYPAGTAHPRSS